MRWPHSCIRPQESLANHTSFRIGGPAEYFAEPATVEELAHILRQAWQLGLPVSILGGGTNTLAPDRGIRGLVIHLGRQFRTAETLDADPDAPTARVRCGAALLTQRLVALGARHGWGELDALAGVPGQLGGAIAMNAQNAGRFIRSVTMLSLNGQLRELPASALHFSYRFASLGSGIVTSAVLEFPKAPAAEVTERVKTVLRYRNSTQDVRLPSAGCAFVNPPGAGAGKMIDQAGLKGARIGDAQVSFRHANFIVNMGQATSDHVLALMEHVQRTVQREFSVLLRPEIRLLGEAWGA